MPDVHSLHALQFVHSRHFIFLFPLAFSAWRDTTNKSVYQISELNLEPRDFGLTHTTSIELKEDLEEEAAEEEDSAASSSSEEEAAEEEDAEDDEGEEAEESETSSYSISAFLCFKDYESTVPYTGLIPRYTVPRNFYTAVYRTAKFFIP